MKRRSSEEASIRSVALRNAQSILAARQRAERELIEAKTALEEKSEELASLLAIHKTAEEAQGRLAAIVASSHDAIISKDVNGVIVSWNEAAQHLYGYTEEEAVGQSILMLIPPERAEEEATIMARLLRGERIEDLETVRVAKDGRRVDVSVTVSPVRDSRGRIIGASKIARDITQRLRAERAIRESEVQFRLLSNALPQIVWTARPDGYIDYFNDRWYEFTGLPRETFGDESWRQALHPDDLHSCTDAYYTSIVSGDLFQSECRLLERKTGTYRWMLSRAFPIRDDNGAIIRWFGSSTDIHETKRNEQVNRFLADASATLSGLTDYESALRRVAHLAVPIFADWCAVDIADNNGTLRRLATYPTAEGAPQPGTASYSLQNAVQHEQRVVQRVFRTGVTEWIADTTPDTPGTTRLEDEEVRLARLLGVRSLISSPLRSQAGTHGVISFASAESGRSYTAADLVAAEDLANRAAIAVENGGLLVALKERDQRKDEFLAMLAHELRNPLAPIRNALHIIRVKGPPTQEVQWARDVIERQVLQLNRLVDDLLDVSRITRGKIELRRETVELRTVVNSAIEASRPAIERQRHELKVTLPEEQICIDVDVTRIAQVLSNLLNNAAKYTPRGGHISIEAQLDGRDVVVRVKDDGIGISPDMLPQIFEMFAQADSSLERSQGGLGIGLTLVQLLVEMHGGTVAANSEGLGTGSEFVVRLPIAVPRSRPADLTGGGLSESLGSFPKRSILIVDDNRDAADSLAMLLQLAGSEVRTVHDGLEGIDAVAQQRPEVVILDIGLPGMNGYDVARHLRETYGDALVLIALTGWGQEEDRRRSREAGFDFHLTKPIGLEALKMVLRTTRSR